MAVRVLAAAVEIVSDRADGLCLSEARHETATEASEDRPLDLDRGVGRLIEDPSNLAVALR